MHRSRTTFAARLAVLAIILGFSPVLQVFAAAEECLVCCTMTCQNPPDEPPPPPLDHPVVRLDGDAAVVLDRAGARHQLAARIWWPCDAKIAAVDPWLAAEGCPQPPPEVAVLNPYVEWISSDPDQVAVDHDGLATALTETAYAMVMARIGYEITPEPPDTQEPAFAGVMVGAYQDALVRVPGSLVLGATTVPASLDGDLLLQLTVDGAELPPTVRVGRHVLFGAGFAVAVTRLERSPENPRAMLVTGRPLRLTEIFAELDMDYDPAAQNPEVLEFLAAVRGGGGQPERGGGKALSCGLIVDSPAFLGVRSRVVVRNGALATFYLLFDGLLGITTTSDWLETRLQCSAEVLSLGVEGLPALPGLAFTAKESYRLVARLELDVAPGARVKLPEISVMQPIDTGIIYTSTGGVEIPGGFGETSVSLAPHLVSTDQDGQDVVVTGWLSIDAVTVLALRVLGADLMPENLKNAFTLVEIEGPTLRTGIGRESRLPTEAFLGADREAYEGPILSDFFFADGWLIRSGKVATHQFADIIGIPTGFPFVDPVHLVPRTRAIFPVPQKPVSQHDTLFIGGSAAGLPECTPFFSILPAWSHTVADTPIDICRIDAWYDQDGLEGAWQIAGQDLRGTYCAEPGDRHGTLKMRARCQYRPWYSALGPLADDLPSVSPIHEIEIEPTADLYLSAAEGRDFGLVEAAIGSSTPRIAEVRNATDSDVAYRLYSTDHPGLEFSTELREVEARGVQPVPVTFHCGSTPSLWQGHLRAVPELPGTDVGTDYELACVAFYLTPRSRAVSRKVGQSWTTSATFTPAIDAPFSVTVQTPGGVSASPSSFLATEPTVITFSGQCSLNPGSSTHHVTVSATYIGGDGEPGSDSRTSSIRVRCDEDGGISWGDPHLTSHDGVAFDLQAHGELVLSRDAGDFGAGGFGAGGFGAGDFEVQVRQQPIGDGRVSVNTAIALGVAGSRLGFYAEPPVPGGEVMLDGQALDVATVLPHDGSSLPLPEGGTLTRTGDGRFEVSWPDSNAMVALRRIESSATFFNLKVHPPDAAGQLEGLLGDGDGDPGNDFRLRDGTALPSPPSHQDLLDCTGGRRCLAYDDPDGWLIRDHDESLFDYAGDLGPLDFAAAPGAPDAPVSLDEFTAQEESWADGLCRAAGIDVLASSELRGCVLDILATGDIALGTSGADYAPWRPSLPLVPDQPVAQGRFGTRMASDDDLLAVTGADSAVYVFERRPDGWHQLAHLGSPQPGDEYGAAFALDGDRLAIGAPADDQAGTDAGAVYVYERHLGGPDAWGLAQVLLPQSPADHIGFGRGVALGGGRLAVGAPSGGPCGNCGRVDLFELGGQTWSLVSSLDGGGNGIESLGYRVALDGDLLVAAAPYSANGHRWQQGRLVVFEHSAGTWSVAAHLLGTTGAFNHFGKTSLTLADGMVMASERTQVDDGALWLFGRHVGGIDGWGAIKRLQAPDAAPGDRFGYAAVTDGKTLLVGAYYDDDAGGASGAAYLFDRDLGGPDAWGLLEKITPPGLEADDELGFSVAFGDGWLAAGAPGTSPTETGMVHLLSR